MKKIEIIWREILYQSMEKGVFRFTQKDLANKFDFSTSTVSQALDVPRKMGAVRVTGRFFEVEDAEKLLYHWASHRRLLSDLSYSTSVNLSVFEIEGQMVADATFAAYSAVRFLFGEPPADYDKVYVYHPDPGSLKSRFTSNESKNAIKNLFVLKADPFTSGYGQITTLAQTFVDLWNLSDWYAKDFIKLVKEKIDGLLS